MEHIFKEDVCEEVRNFVYSSMVNGTEYISERSIAEKFNLKRGSSRDILLSLEGEGILQRVPQKGYRLIDYQQTDVTTIRAVRFVLEREAARKAMVNATREDILRMTLACEDMDRFAEENNGEAFREADIAFHHAIIIASHDNMLKNMFEFITSPVFHMKIPARELFFKTNASHKKMLAVLKRRDWPNMERLLCGHMGQIYHGDATPIKPGSIVGGRGESNLDNDFKC